MVRAEFEGRQFYCPYTNDVAGSGACLTDGDRVVALYGKVPFATCVGALLLFLLLVHGATFGSHVWLARRQRAK